jgi:hypothetical protein
LALVAHAARTLPHHRADWAHAIRNEIQHISGDREALAWALGCVLASFAERMNAMSTRALHVSGWVLSLEMLICFVPLTFFFLAVASVSIFGNMSALDGLRYLSVAATGPIGLIFAFKGIVLKRPSLSRTAIAALCIPAAWTFAAYSLLVLGSEGIASDSWRGFILIALLPAVGSTHLVFLGRESGSERVTA